MVGRNGDFKVLFSFPFDECESGRIMFAKNIKYIPQFRSLEITFYEDEKDGYRSLFQSWMHPLFEAKGQKIPRKSEIARNIQFLNIPTVYNLQFKNKAVLFNYYNMYPMEINEDNCTISFMYDYVNSEEIPYKFYQNGR